MLDAVSYALGPSRMHDGARFLRISWIFLTICHVGSTGSRTDRRVGGIGGAASELLPSQKVTCITYILIYRSYYRIWEYTQLQMWIKVIRTGSYIGNTKTWEKSAEHPVGGCKATPRQCSLHLDVWIHNSSRKRWEEGEVQLLIREPNLSNIDGREPGKHHPKKVEVACYERQPDPQMHANTQARKSDTRGGSEVGLELPGGTISGHRRWVNSKNLWI
ncbi:hypothetical protein B0H11DRAFT_1943178 [Mycena galericulata]|nr:hypothetical protein B0H11DRAFT_1943178 [Mycena galericulata]